MKQLVPINVCKSSAGPVTIKAANLHSFETLASQYVLIVTLKIHKFLIIFYLTVEGFLNITLFNANTPLHIGVTLQSLRLYV